MHERLARWLAGIGAADEVVGAHLERAASDSDSESERVACSRKAATLLGSAGFRALMAADHAAAANLLARASALLHEDDPGRMELECLQAQALRGLGIVDERLTLLKGVVDRARRAGARRLELRAEVELIHSRLEAGTLEVAGAVELLETALAVFAEEGDTLGTARAEFAYASALSNWDRRVDSSLAHVLRMREAYARLGYPAHGGGYEVMLATIGGTRVADALVICGRAMVDAADAPRLQAYLRLQLAYLEALSADVDGARADAASACRELEALGETLGLGIVVGSQHAAIAALAGDWARARELLELALASVRAHPAQPAWEGYFVARLAEAALESGDAATAAALADEARTLVLSGDVDTEMWWRRVACRARAATGERRKALRLGREAVALADATDDLLAQGGARLDLAEALVLAGRTAEAARLVDDARRLFDRKGAKLAAVNARVRFANLPSERIAHEARSPA